MKPITKEILLVGALLCTLFLICGCGCEHQTLVLFGQSNANRGVYKSLEENLSVEITRGAVDSTPLSCKYSSECWMGSLLTNLIPKIGSNAAYFVFLQGESDAQQLDTAYDYEANLLEMVNQVEKINGPGHWAFSLLRRETPRVGNDIVRDAITSVAKQMNACLVDLENYEGLDGTHLTAKGYQELGKDIANCLKGKQQ